MYLFVQAQKLYKVIHISKLNYLKCLLTDNQHLVYDMYYPPKLIYYDKNWHIFRLFSYFFSLKTSISFVSFVRQFNKKPALINYRCIV